MTGTRSCAGRHIGVVGLSNHALKRVWEGLIGLRVHVHGNRFDQDQNTGFAGLGLSHLCADCRAMRYLQQSGQQDYKARLTDACPTRQQEALLGRQPSYTLLPCPARTGEEAAPAVPRARATRVSLQARAVRAGPATIACAVGPLLVLQSHSRAVPSLLAVRRMAGEAGENCTAVTATCTTSGF